MIHLFLNNLFCLIINILTFSSLRVMQECYLITFHFLQKSVLSNKRNMSLLIRTVKTRFCSRLRERNSREYTSAIVKSCYHSSSQKVSSVAPSIKSCLIDSESQSCWSFTSIGSILSKSSGCKSFGFDLLSWSCI